MQATTLAAQKHECDALAQELADLAEAQHQDDLTVLVAGEFKKGKSTFINALLNLDVCPVDAEVSTSVPTVLRYAASAWTLAHCVDASTVHLDETAWRYAIQHGLVRDADGQEKTVNLVERGVARRLLELGITMIDTSGGAGVSSPESEAALHVIGPSSAVLFITDCSQELTAAELQFIRRATRRAGRVVVVMTKRDLYPAWRKIVALNEQHLQALDAPVQVLPVSNWLRIRGMAHDDQDMLAESGMAAVAQLLARSLVPAKDRIHAQAILSRCRDSVDQMRAGLAFEQGMLRADDGAGLKASLENQSAAARALASQSSKWNTLLADAVADLSGSIDHRLGGITRSLSAEIDELVDATDPSEDPSGLLADIRNRLGERVGQCLDELHAGGELIATRVATAIDAEARDLVGESSGLDATSFFPEIEFDVSARPRLPALVMTGLRGSYGGVAMFGLFSGLFAGAISGLIFAPATVAVGAVFGHRSARDEGKRRLDQRRAEARQQARKFVDTAIFELRAHIRQTLRELQRTLRDQCVAHVAMMTDRNQQALDALQASARLDAVERDTRLRELQADLDELAQIDTAAKQVQAELAP